MPGQMSRAGALAVAGSSLAVCESARGLQALAVCVWTHHARYACACCPGQKKKPEVTSAQEADGTAYLIHALPLDHGHKIVISLLTADYLDTRRGLSRSTHRCGMPHCPCKAFMLVAC